MSAVHLRLYTGPSEAADPEPETSRGYTPTTVLLADVLPLLADAYEARRTWLRDFEDEELTISADLYEVILTYQFHRRPSA